MKKLLALVLISASLPLITVGCAHAATQNGASTFDFNFGDQGEDEENKPKAPLNPYDKKYRPMAEQDAGEGLLPNILQFSGIRYQDGQNPDDIKLVGIAPANITGCLKAASGSVELKYEAGVLKVLITQEQPEIDTDTRRYAHYTCELRNAATKITTTFSRQSLIDHHITKIQYVMEGGASQDPYEIKLDDHKLTVNVPALPPTGRFKGEPAQLVQYWFFPEHTLMLSAPGAPGGEDNMVRLKTLARAKGLTPLDELYTDFTPPKGHSQTLFAVDTNNIFTEKLPTIEDTITIGDVKISEPFYGPEGRTLREIPKHVYARRAGLYE